MNNVLLIGNGFDLAHGLPTSYNDFLFIMKNWNIFCARYKSAKRGRTLDETDVYYKYLTDVDIVNEKNVDILGEIIKRNNWVKYYCGCEAEIDGWIDFEREIYPVLQLVEKIFNTVYKTLNSGTDMAEVHIPKEQLGEDELRMASLWTRFFDVSASHVIKIRTPFASNQYGILKKKIIKYLREDFNEFIYAFELYLLEFVYKKSDVGALKQVKEIDITTVISFNYTLTEEIYGVSKDDVHHIHGMIRDDFTTEKNNMVMGVNEQEDSNMDFIYFVKYFQRIQKASGVRYKELIQKKTTDGMMTHRDYILHIYGHSLDKTDEDILRYVIGDRDASGKMKLKPKEVIIFFYDDADYEQKVINLIKLYGRPIVEEYMEDKKFKFVKTTNEQWSES